MPHLSPQETAAIIHQHAHDIRNGLNNLDLQAALLTDEFVDVEARQTLERMRMQVRKMEAAVKALSIKFAEPQISRTPAREVLEQWKYQSAEASSTVNVAWFDALGSEMIAVDLNAVVMVLCELLVRASRAGRRPLAGGGRRQGNNVVFELRETLRQPAVQAQAVEVEAAGPADLRRLIELNGGEVDRAQSPDTREIVTSLSFALV